MLPRRHTNHGHMISYVTGNLFESPAQTLVNTVNTVGVMGKGIALTFKRIYPDMFREYQSLCDERKLTIGQLHLYRTSHKLILNFPTKEHWRRPSKLSYIEAGLHTFVRTYQDVGIQSIAFPPLGCGNGELDFEDVRRVMERFLEPLPIPVYIYPPQPRNALPEHRTPDTICRWLRGEPHALAFAEVWDDLRALLSVPLDLKTLTKGTPYVAEYIDGVPHGAIRIRATGKTGIVDRRMVLDVWRDLQHHGFATSRTADSRHTAFIFPLLARLPYVSVVRLADDYEGFSFNKAWGLQLVPAGSPEPQRALAF